MKICRLFCQCSSSSGSTKLSLAQSKCSANVNSPPRSARCVHSNCSAVFSLFGQSLAGLGSGHNSTKLWKNRKCTNGTGSVNLAADISNPSGLDCKSSNRYSAKIPVGRLSASRTADSRPAWRARPRTPIVAAAHDGANQPRRFQGGAGPAMGGA